MRFTPALLCLALLAGCSNKVEETNPSETYLFGPTAMRIHPIFSQIKDWTGDGNPDGIEVLLEFQDQFGDPTKAAGTVMFELYDYRQADPEMRGQRVVNPWIGSMLSATDQRSRWNRTSRTYTFQLSYPQISKSKSYVLTATFRSVAGGRFFSKVVFEAQEDTSATTKPTSRPTKPFGF